MNNNSRIPSHGSLVKTDSGNVSQNFAPQAAYEHFGILQVQNDTINIQNSQADPNSLSSDQPINRPNQYLSYLRQNANNPNQNPNANLNNNMTGGNSNLQDNAQQQLLQQQNLARSLATDLKSPSTLDSKNLSGPGFSQNNLNLNNNVIASPVPITAYHNQGRSIEQEAKNSSEQPSSNMINSNQQQHQYQDHHHAQQSKSLYPWQQSSPQTLPNSGEQTNQQSLFATNLQSANGSELKQRGTLPESSLPQKVNDLEHALRQEIIANEEQRSYIVILKTVIEKKMDREGILQLFKDTRNQKLSAQKSHFQTFGSSEDKLQRAQQVQSDPVDTYLTAFDLKDRFKAQEEVILEQQSHLDRAYKKIEQIEGQNRRLAKEKDDLLDCIETLQKSNEELMQQLPQQRQSELSQTHGGDNKTQQMTQGSIHEGSSQNIMKNVSQEVNSNKDANQQDLMQQVQSLQDHITSLEAKNQHLVEKEQSLADKLKQYQLHGGPTSQNFDSPSFNLLSNEQISVKDLQREKLKLQKRLDLKTIEVEELNAQLFEQQNSHNQNLHTSQRFQLDNKDDLNNRITLLEDQLDQSKEKLSQQLLVNKHYQKTSAKINQEMTLRQNQLEQLRNNLNEALNEKAQFKIKIDKLESELDTEKTQHANCRDNLMQLQNQKDQMLDERRKLTEENMYLDRDKQILTNEKDLQLNQLNEQLSALKTDYSNVKQQLTKTQDLLQQQTLTAQQSQIELSQSKSQEEYLRNGNIKLERDRAEWDYKYNECNRTKQELELKNKDLTSENEQLYRVQDSYKRLQVDFDQMRQSFDKKQNEISKMDAQLREAKQEAAHSKQEYLAAKREVAKLEGERSYLQEQKTQVTCAGIESERRIFDLQKQTIESDKRAMSAIEQQKRTETYMTDLKDTLRKLEIEKEDLESEVRNERSKITQYCLLDEKLTMTVGGVEGETQKLKHYITRILSETLNLVDNSQGLKEIITMSRREQARVFLKQIDDISSVELSNIESINVENDQEDQNGIWLKFRTLVSELKCFAEALNYIHSIQDITMNNLIENFSQKKLQTKQIELMSTRITQGTGAMIDYEAQNTIEDLKLKLRDANQQIEHQKLKLTHTVEDFKNKTVRLNQQNQNDDQLGANQTGRSAHSNFLATVHNQEQQAVTKELDNKLAQMSNENGKLKMVLQKVMGYVRGMPGERILEQMVTSAQVISKLEFQVEEQTKAIQVLEQSMRLEYLSQHQQYQNAEGGFGNENASNNNLMNKQLTATDPLTLMRQTQKELAIRESDLHAINDRLQLERSKLRYLEQELLSAKEVQSLNVTQQTPLDNTNTGNLGAGGNSTIQSMPLSQGNNQQYHHQISQKSNVSAVLRGTSPKLGGTRSIYSSQVKLQDDLMPTRIGASATINQQSHSRQYLKPDKLMYEQTKATK